MTTLTDIAIFALLIAVIVVLAQAWRVLRSADQALRRAYVPDARNEDSTPQEATNDGKPVRPEERYE
jgi:hypothetical protein